jgi:two-component system phosphate regulon sensor histidine kinase PhoR
VDCAAELTANLNPGLFQQAILNLLDNAIAYSDPGTQVRVAASRTERELRLTVADQGRGIAPEHLGRIFERFYRVDKARSREAGGTGLGLAIVKHVVQAHKGRVEVESTVGTGSTFTIILPLP